MAIDIQSALQFDPTELPCEEIIFGSTKAMREIRRRIDAILAGDLPVLIQGECGTGKEVIARFLHSRSTRHEFPFVRLNCAAAPPSLLEAKLFGAEGGFLHSDSGDLRRDNRLPSSGTLYLDDIASMDWDLQRRLNQFLEVRSREWVGDDERQRANIRIICSANIELEGLVSAGVFRQDLFGSIGALSLRLLPLRDRKSDIPQLFEYFLRKLSVQFGRSVPPLCPETLSLLKQREWPGNLRELENWAARTIILGDVDALGPEFRHCARVNTDTKGLKDGSSEVPKRPARHPSRVDVPVIVKALRADRWNRRMTIQDLNLGDRSSLSILRGRGASVRRRTHRGIHPMGDG